MIKKETLVFFKELEQNNNKPWFEKNKPRYLAAQEDFLNFIEKLLPEIRKIDTIYEKDLKKYAHRVYRDVRFSKDKSPYKNHISGVIDRAPDNKKCPLYIHIQPGSSFIGGGVYQPSPDLLKKVRQEIDYNGSEFNKIINKKSFISLFGPLDGTPLFDKVTPDKLVRPPKGYAEDNPNIELIKLKQYIVHRHFDDDLVCSKNLIKEIVGSYKQALPFFNFLDTVLEEA
jgi:uncharacterized protein (TIGR02453 family)